MNYYYLYAIYYAYVCAYVNEQQFFNYISLTNIT